MTALIASTSFFLLIFLTDVALLPAATVGSALLVAKLWDTVNDPLLGWYLDRTRHRWPLRRWLYVGALPLAVTTAALWFIPSGLPTTARVVWVVAAYLLFDTFFTATQLAFSALSAEATSEYDARTRFVAFGAIGGVLGYGLGASAIDVAKRFVSTPALAYTLGGVAMGVLAAVGLGLAGRYVHPHRPPPPASAPPGRILDALRERPFVMLAVATGASRLGFTMVSVGLPYYAKYHLHDERLAARLVMVLMAVIAVMVPVWRRAGLRGGKAKAYAASLGLVSVVLLASWLVPSGATGLAYVFVALVGVGMAGHWVLPWAILPDVVDDAEASCRWGGSSVPLVSSPTSRRRTRQRWRFAPSSGRCRGCCCWRRCPFSSGFRWTDGRTRRCGRASRAARCARSGRPPSLRRCCAASSPGWRCPSSRCRATRCASG